MKETEKAISEVLKNSPQPFDDKHGIKTRQWLLKLKPDASEEMQVAALIHDIDRAVPPRVIRGKEEYYDDYKKRHAMRSAEIAQHFLIENGYDEEKSQKVRDLVEKHEVGGDSESDFLRDADSITFFDSIVNDYESTGAAKLETKIRFMYSRCSERAKEIIRGLKFEPEIKKIFDKAISQ
ncbi:DUF4202 family protein [Nanoarchaeota archaeon]